MNNFSYRLIFSKTKNAVYISHLDVMRTFTRAFRRSNTPIYYTEGFTKRPYLVFPYPLSLGVAGENEILDIKTYEQIVDVNDYMICLNEVLADGIAVHEIQTGKYITSYYAIYSIEYTVKISDESIQSFISQDIIKAEKYSKKRGNVEFDLKPFLKSIELINDNTIKVVLPVGETNNVNVNVFMKSFSDFTGMKYENFYAKRIEFIP